jgi:hypothetical protein
MKTQRRHKIDPMRAAVWIGYPVLLVGLLVLALAGCATLERHRGAITAVGTFIAIGAIAAHQDHGAARTQLPPAPNCAQFPESCR